MEIARASLPDYLVIGGFMSILIVTGFVFKKFTHNASEYFVGAHKVAWWMAGISLFMSGFSANTFTGAMGLAYENGITGLFITWSFVTGFAFAFIYSASRFRQTRCITPVEMIRGRFGVTTERLFAVIGLPLSVLVASIWLYGLSIFASTVVQFDTRLLILLTGTVILIYSTLGGTVAVQAADVIQAAILLPVTIIFAIYVLVQDRIGGLGGLVQQLPPSHLSPLSETHTLPWLIVWHIQGLFLCGGCHPRYLSVRDGLAARKVALVAALLFLVGPIFWYVPALACRVYFPELDQALPGLSKPAEGAYAVMALELLPRGVVGLMVAAMFAATMSSMDSAFNSNAGVFVVNIYKGWLRKSASHQEQVLAGRIANICFGLLIMLVAYYYSTLRELGVFDITIAIMAAIAYPMALPGVLLLFFRRTPLWSAVVSALCGVTMGLVGQAKLIPGLSHFVPHIQEALRALGAPEMFIEQPWSFPVQSLTVLVTVCLAFAICRLAWRIAPSVTKDQIEAFYEQMDTPVNAVREVGQSEDHRFLVGLGILVLSISVGVTLLLLDPVHTMSDRLLILSIVSLTSLLGVTMVVLGRKTLLKARRHAGRAAVPAATIEESSVG